MWQMLLLSLVFAGEPEGKTPSEEPLVSEEAPEAAEVAEAAESVEAGSPEAESPAAESPEAESPEAEPEPEAVDPFAWMPGRVSESSPHYDLEVLYAELKYEEATRIARERLAANPDDVKLHWMIIRSLYEKGEQFPRTDESVDKRAIYQEMIDISEHGLSIAPDDPHMLFARGLALGRMGTHRGVLASLFSAKEIEDSWVRAAVSGHEYASIKGNEQMPCDVFLGLGIYYRLVPDWWIVKLLAGTRGSLPKSIDWLERANTCAPRRIRVLKELGVSYMCQGHKTKNPELIEKGKETIKQYFDVEPLKPTEHTDMKHGRWLLENTKEACEYSRDGQQDLDREKLDTP
jgi:tetratricopeptide (TPR) repeat protein